MILDLFCRSNIVFLGDFNFSNINWQRLTLNTDIYRGHFVYFVHIYFLEQLVNRTHSHQNKTYSLDLIFSNPALTDRVFASQLSALIEL